MARFSKGDRVRLIGNSMTNFGVKHGTKGTVDQDGSRYPWVIWDTAMGDRRWPAHEDDLELVTKKSEEKTTMTKIVEAVRDRFLDADTKAARKAGLEATDGSLTGDGKEMLLTLLYQERKADLVGLLPVEEPAKKPKA